MANYINKIMVDGVEYSILSDTVNMAGFDPNLIMNQKAVTEQHALALSDVAQTVFQSANYNRSSETNYAFSTSTFSGWVTSFQNKSNVCAVTEVQVGVRARDKNITKLRLQIVRGNRAFGDIVFDQTINAHVEAYTERIITVPVGYLTIFPGESMCLAAAFDQICDSLFTSASESSYSWYVTDGDLQRDIKDYSDGTPAGLWCNLIGFAKGKSITELGEDLRVTNVRIDQNADSIGKTDKSLKDINDKLNRSFETSYDITAKDAVALVDPSADPIRQYYTPGFYGWGTTVGVAQNFNAVKIEFDALSTNESLINQLRLRICTLDASAVLTDTLYDKIHSVNISPGQHVSMIIHLNDIVANTDAQNLYIIYNVNGNISGYIRRSEDELTPPAYKGSTYVSVPDVTYNGLATVYPVPNTYLPYIVPVMYEERFEASGGADDDDPSVPEESTAEVSVTLPDRFIAVVGDTLQLFYRGFIEHPNPYIFNIECTCPVGFNTPRYFEVTPTAAQVGTHTFKVYVRNYDNSIAAEASCELEVVEKASSPSTVKNILCVGDSLTVNGIWPVELHRRLTQSGGAPAGDSLANINFIGTVEKSGVRYEGYGGWNWATYVSKPSVSTADVWVYCVHNKTVNDQHSLWLDENGNIWKLETLEDDRLKFTRYEGHTASIPTSGTLTHYQNANSTSTITYSSIQYADTNPFWDNNTDTLNFSTYCTRNGFTGIDIVYILLGWNWGGTGTSKSTSINAAKTFIETLHAQIPAAQVRIVGFQLPSLNGGTGANYGATGSYANAYKLCRDVLDFNRKYQELADNYSYVEFVCLSAQFDSENNMPQTSKNVNTRSTSQEQIGTNGVHPATPGYYQIADAVYRDITKYL